MSTHPDTPMLRAPDLVDTSRLLAEWFAAEAPQWVPDGLAHATLTRTAHTRRRAAWRFPGRWLPMTIALRPTTLPRLSLFLALALGAALIAAGAFYVASQPAPAPDRLAGVLVSPHPAATASVNLTGVTAIGAGKNHTCALLIDGHVRCWGAGQLGDGSQDASATPVEVSGVVGAKAIGVGSNVLGSDTGCAIVGDAVRCWGSNPNGELIGSSADDDGPLPDVLTPIEIPGLRGATALVMRGNYPCALVPGEAVRCHQPDQPLDGQATNGMGLATGDLTWTANATGAVAQLERMCALMPNGEVFCADWGEGGSDTPIQVPGLDDAVAIAADQERACAIVTDGKLRCWVWTGPSYQGTPVEVPGLTGVTSVALGYTFGDYGCAVLADGHVRCWGTNAVGQLGDGSRMDATEPVEVQGLTDATAVTVGEAHACALRRTSEVVCWGSSRNGQVGAGDRSRPATPVEVQGLRGATRIAANQNGSTCAVGDNGSVHCWGSNESGQLGDGTFTTRQTPVEVVGLTDATDVTVGSRHTCAIVDGGQVRCWGANESGQLGDGTMVTSPLPVTVVGLEGARAVAATGPRTCAIVADGTVQCWGRYPWDGDDISSVPATVPGIQGATALVAGAEELCAAVTADKVYCWGYTGRGWRDGDVTPKTPVEVSGLEGVAALGSGQEHTCALMGDSTVRCWGVEWGDEGHPGPFDPVPVAVASLDGVTAITAGGGSACAIVQAGRVRCWGGNESGQLGDGTTTNSLVPVEVVDVTGAIAIAVGGEHACAVIDGGAVRCWGENEDGRLGDGSPPPAIVTVLAGAD